MYKSIQKWRKNKFQTKTNDAKYENGNPTYYESIDYNGSIIKHWCKYDYLNRCIYHKNSKDEITWYEYHKDTKQCSKISEYYINNGTKVIRNTIYDIKGNIINRIIYTGNVTLFQDWTKPTIDCLYTESVTYSPFFIV